MSLSLLHYSIGKRNIFLMLLLSQKLRLNVGLNMGQTVSFDKTDDARSLFWKQLLFYLKKEVIQK